MASMHREVYVLRVSQAPRLMDPRVAAAVLQRRIQDPTKPMTVADASVAGGLSLRDTESGLHWLTSEFRGHLRVTDDGDLIYLFPHGFNKPWRQREEAWRILAAIGRAASTVGRFLVRAWLLVAMIGYALLFVGIFLALTFAKGSEDRDVGAPLLGGILRALADALFWTFHPWSPLYAGEALSVESGRSGRRRDPNEVPFYEKVNRFVFGPPTSATSKEVVRSRILHEIRAQKGLIGLADVMRITGLGRSEADPLMARLMLEHDGDVFVGDQGGIFYRFEAMRRTASEGDQPAPAGRQAAWETPAIVPPLTGNAAESNIVIAALNGFNLVAAAWAIHRGLTLENLFTLLTTHLPKGAPPLVLTDHSLPIALGMVPLMFSLALFVLPLARAFARQHKMATTAQENARLAILREVLTRAPHKEPVPDEAIRSAYRIATGVDPTSEEVTARVVDLGGDVDVGPAGEIRYRFRDLETEAEALEEERAQVSPAQARLGRIVFASDE